MYQDPWPVLSGHQAKSTFSVGNTIGCPSAVCVETVIVFVIILPATPSVTTVHAGAIATTAAAVCTTNVLIIFFVPLGGVCRCFDGTAGGCICFV